MPSSETPTDQNSPAPFDLSQGRNMLAIPGPSIMPDAVMAAMARPIQNIYEGEVADLCWSLVGDLPKVVRTEGEAFTAIGNGYGAWEMVRVRAYVCCVCARVCACVGWRVRLRFCGCRPGLCGRARSCGGALSCNGERGAVL